MCTVGLVLWIVDSRQLLNLSLWIVGDNYFHRIQYSTDANGAAVKIIADSTLQKSHLVESIVSGIANLIDKLDDTFGTVASATETADGWHTGIIPSVHKTFVHQCQQVAFRHQRIAQVQLVEFRLARAVVLDIIGLTLPFFHPGNEQIVQGTMLYKLQRTPRMGYSLQIVALAVGEVVHGVGIPFVACTDMGDVQYSVDQRITEEHVGMSHINLCSQDERSWFALAAVHEFEELQVLLNRTIAERTVGSWTGGRTFLLGDDLSTLLVHIGTALLDEPHGKVPQLLEVVAGIVDVGPLESQPFDIVLDALDIFRIFLDGVCIIEAEVTHSSVFLGQTEVDGDSLGVSDVQITIGLWWETGLHPASVLTFCQVVDHLLLDEADRLLFLTLIQYFLFHFLLSYYLRLQNYNFFLKLLQNCPTIHYSLFTIRYFMPLSFSALLYLAAFLKCSE